MDLAPDPVDREQPSGNGDLTVDTAHRLALFTATFRGAEIPTESVPWQDARARSTPSMITSTRTLTGPSRWAPVVAWRAAPGQMAALDRYVATVLGDLAASRVEFRLKRGGRLLPGVTFTPGVDRHKASATDYPVRWQPMFMLMQDQQDLVLEARKLTAGAAVVLAGFGGWRYDSPNSAEPGGDKRGLNARRD